MSAHEKAGIEAPVREQTKSERSERHATESDAGEVLGDRGIPSVNRARSLQARISNALAIGLMSTLGIGLLVWYYTQSFAQRTQSQDKAQAQAKEKAEGEMTLPALGRIEAPRVEPTVIERVLGPPPTDPALSFAEEGFGNAHAVGGYGNDPAAPAPSARNARLDRRLSGAAFVAHAAKAAEATSDPESELAYAPVAASSSERSIERAGSSLEARLTPTVMRAAFASVLPTQRLLLAKGSFLDCTLETAIDSTLPGLSTCVMATDAFSADGSVVLLERGTKLIGETRGDVRHGSSRIFVLWSEARTPDGVVVPLASPAADELGRSGLPGDVDRHFFERFGAAILISVIDGAVQSAVMSSRDGGAVIYNPSTSRDIMTEVLRSTVNIPPTVRKHNGDRVQVLVARDLDFRTVYELSAQSVPSD